MAELDRDQFLGLPSHGFAEAAAVIVPLPFEQTTSYGKGTGGAPRAILDASCQLEFFDEETGLDFERAPALHTLPPLQPVGSVQDYLSAVREHVRPLRGKFVLGLGGEHTVTYGLVRGLTEDIGALTVVQIDAHADLIDELDGLKWSHGTVMRRLLDEGCRLIQLGVRSLSSQEHELILSAERVTTFFAHELPSKWSRALTMLKKLEGPVYLTIDVDGLSPSVIPSTGTPQPDGLSWRQTMEIIQTVASAHGVRLIGADVVEFVPSPHPPGCDIVAARLAMKILAFWYLHHQSAR
jgi:agmatinase